MKILLHVGLPLLLQLAITWGLIVATTGDGSFAGLAVMLLGVLGIPLTTLVNILRLSPQPSASWTLLLSLLLPALQFALVAAVLMFDL